MPTKFWQPFWGWEGKITSKFLAFTKLLKLLHAIRSAKAAMEMKFGKTWQHVGPFRTPFFQQRNTRLLMRGQGRRGGRGGRTPLCIEDKVEGEVQEAEIDLS